MREELELKLQEDLTIQPYPRKYPQNIKGIQQDVKVNLIIRGKETIFCGRIS